MSSDWLLEKLEQEKIWLLDQVPESEKWFARFVWNRVYEDFRIIPEQHAEGYGLANQDLRKFVESFYPSLSVSK